MINYLTLLVAIIVAGIAAYFSTVGIALIFSGSFWAAIIMGCSLEAGKIIAVSWLYRHWYVAHTFLKVYLLSAIVILSLITSLGIFGFLSRAHIAQQATLETGAASQIELLDNQINQKKNSILDIDKRVTLIDDALRKMIETNKAQTSIRIADGQKKNREALNGERLRIVSELNDLQDSRTRLSNEVRISQVDLGPIRYFADFFFEKSDTGTLERAVRWMIIIIIMVFDPLSIALFIAYNTGVTNKLLTNDYDPDTIFIHKDDLGSVS